MLEYFHQHLNAITTPLSGGDPLSKGMVTVWALTVLGYLGRSFPLKLYYFVKRQLTVSATVIKDKTGSNIEFFIKYEDWLLKTNTFRVRSLSVNPNMSAGNSTSGFAYGTHLVRCDGKFYLVNKSKLDNDGDGMVLEQMVVTTLGRNTEILEKRFHALSVRDSTRNFYTTSDRSWELWSKLMVITTAPTIFFDKGLKKTIDDAVDFMVNKPEWYAQRSLPRKLTFVFHGAPGTGKTSLTRYIADRVGGNIYTMNFNSIDSSKMLHYMANVSRHNTGRIAVVSIEDFDTFGGLEDRNEEDSKEVKKFKAVDMSAFLNTLQGIVPLENIIVVLTTNHIEKIDPAVLRKGRVDFCEEVKELTLSDVRDHFEYVYKLEFPSSIKDVNPIKACDMQAHFLENPTNPQAYLQAITKHHKSDQSLLVLNKE